MTARYGSPQNPIGMMNIYGRSPLEPLVTPAEYQYYQNVLLNIVTYVTTPEAIARCLPAPLAVDPDAPPVVSVAHLHTAGNFGGMDNRAKPYFELGTWIPCRYKEHRGLTIPFLYLDGPGADIAVISGRELGGYPKKQAIIDSYRHGDYFASIVVREGRALVQMEMRIKDEVPVAATPFASMGDILNVKEIPNSDFSGFDVRKVMASRFGGSMNFLKVWLAEGSVKLGSLPNDPVDLLEIVQPGPSFQVLFESRPGGNINCHYDIEDLLRK